MYKRKVLFLAESLNVGGAEKALISLLGRLDYNAVDITLMLVSDSGGFIKDLDRISGLKRKYIVKPTLSRLKSFINSLKIKAFYRWLPADMVGNYLCKGYDMAVAFTEGYLTKWVAASTHCKKIAWVHTDMVNNDWPVMTGVFSSFEKERVAYKAFDEVVAVSKTVADGLRGRFGLSNVSTVYNILDGDILQKSKEPIEYRPVRRLNLVSVGRLEPVKGYDNLIEAVGILINQRGLDVSLCLVGDGSMRNALEAKAKERGLQNHICFAGSKQNPYPYVFKSDVYVCSSRQEGFNIAILEAMALGKPIISTDSAGPREILDNGKYGILAENTVGGLVDAVCSIYDNTDKIEHCAALSLNRSYQFGSDSQTAKVKELLAL